MKRAFAIVISAVLLAGPAPLPGSGPARAREARAPSPNLVLIVSDDQRWDSISEAFTPNIWNRLVVPGVSFRDAFVPNPLCCPSRTTILTGRYSRRTEVWTNLAPYGGFDAFDDHDTIATDLHDAGYRTALIGKYLNQYPMDHWTYLPPGWDRWFAIETSTYYGYQAAADGKRSQRFGSTPEDYSTEVLTQRAVSFVEKTEARGQPFFLYFAPTAPHVPAIPYPEDAGRFEDEEVPRPPSFGQASASYPVYIQQARWDSQRFGRIDLVHQRQLEAAYGVDRAVGRILDAVPPNTVVIYLSDNGMLWGEHKWLGKGVPYNESIRVPIVMAAMDGRPMPEPDRIVLNVDIRATLASLAGLSPRTQGRDWFDPTWTREGFVVEHMAMDPPKVPSYCGIRTTQWLFVRYATGEEELYDEVLDPFEMENVVAEQPLVAAELRARAQRRCNPAPPGFGW
jgi:N-acetylglucosamine-6-sulfatase